MEKIRWTEREDGKGPLFGTFINDEKVEDNFPLEHKINELKLGRYNYGD